MKSCENCRYRAIDENALPCCACIELGQDLSGWVGLTNADRIRAMTDEELAEFLLGIDKAVTDAWGEYNPHRVIDGRWLRWDEDVLDWLKSPVEVEE